jgi:hypothetical protein
VAEKLGRTVGELRATMGNGEFVQWVIYYGRRNQDREIARHKAQQRR